MLSLAFSAFMAAKPTAAQGISLISDEETEQLLGKIARPLFTAAKVRFNRNDIYIVDDPTLNAFVADGNALFVHTGTIIAADSPNELAGVIAHETGHIEGGHILRQNLRSRNFRELLWHRQFWQEPPPRSAAAETQPWPLCSAPRAPPSPITAVIVRKRNAPPTKRQ